MLLVLFFIARAPFVVCLAIDRPHFSEIVSLALQKQLHTYFYINEARKWNVVRHLRGHHRSPHCILYLGSLLCCTVDCIAEIMKIVLQSGDNKKAGHGHLDPRIFSFPVIWISWHILGTGHLAPQTFGSPDIWVLEHLSLDNCSIIPMPYCELVQIWYSFL